MIESTTIHYIPYNPYNRLPYDCIHRIHCEIAIKNFNLEF